MAPALSLAAIAPLRRRSRSTSSRCPRPRRKREALDLGCFGALSICSTVCLSSFTKGWLSSVIPSGTSAPRLRPSWRRSSAGLPDSCAPAASCDLALALSISSAGTSALRQRAASRGDVHARRPCRAVRRRPRSRPARRSRAVQVRARACPSPAKRLKRRIDMFSPILPIRPLRTSSTVSPSSGRAASAATSAGFCVATSSRERA